MDVIISTVVPAVVPVFITVALGYWLGKSGKPFHMPTTAFLASQLGTPALIVSSLLKTQMPHEAFAELALAAALCLSSFLLIGYVVLKAFRLDIRTYLPSMLFPNVGNLGLPILLYAYGEAGLGYGVIFFAVAAIFNFIIGQGIAAGKANWTGLFKSPTVPAVILGVGGAVLDVKLPVWGMNTLSLLGQLTIPLMLLMLGTSLAEIKIASSVRSVALSLLRIGMGLTIGLIAAYAFGFTGVERAALVLECSMPVAVYNYLFAVIWKTNPEAVASLVVVSTLISMVTIPLMLALLPV